MVRRRTAPRSLFYRAVSTIGKFTFQRNGFHILVTINPMVAPHSVEMSMARCGLCEKGHLPVVQPKNQFQVKPIAVPISIPIATRFNLDMSVSFPKSPHA